MSKLPMKAIAVFFAMIAVTAATSAQAPDCSQRIVVISAVARDGRAIRDLSADAFQSTAKPSAPQVASLRLVHEGHIVILLDVSSSMRSERKLRTALGMVVESVRSVPANWKVEIVLFADTVKQKADVSQNRAEITKILADLLAKTQVRGRTALLDVIDESIGLFTASQSAKSMLVVTDTGDNSSRASGSKLERLLLQQGIRLFVASLPDPLNYRRTGEEHFRERELGRLAEVSGGAVRHWTLQEDVKIQEIQDFVGLMSTAFFLELRITAQPPKPAGWKLQPTSDMKNKWKDMTLLYPRKILPCQDVAAAK